MTGQDRCLPDSVARRERARRERAQRLLESLRIAQNAAAPATIFEVPPPPDRELEWLRRNVGLPVHTPGYEREVARLTGPDLFGLGWLPPPPRFLAGVDAGALRPEQVAPFLRLTSMTGPAPAAADLSAAALDSDPGQVSRFHRTASQRQWGQPASPGVPLLPAHTVIPHVVHGIWLGGPVPEDSVFRRNYAAGARRYAGAVDFVVWTDVPREYFDAARAAPARPGPLAAVRSMLAWATRNGIHLVNVHEVFHAGQPMTLHLQYTAEMAKQVPRGYAGASDHLRLEIGGLEQMAQRYAGRPRDQIWLRYTVPLRSGQLQGAVLGRLGFSLNDARLIRARPAICGRSELSWSRTAPPAPAAPLTDDQITTLTARAITTLARQLTTREGNLHLTAIAPVITTLPHPDAAWTAILTLLAELTHAGTIPPVTSLTQFRWNDDGTPQHLTLPPEAEALLDRTTTPATWLGATLATPGHPAWLLDEATTPATLRPQPRTPHHPLTTTTSHHGTTTLHLQHTPAPDRSPPPGSLPPGSLAIHLEGRFGEAWNGPHRITPEDLALHLHHLHLTDRPVYLINPAHDCHTLRPFATRLQTLLHHPVLTIDGT